MFVDAWTHAEKKLRAALSSPRWIGMTRPDELVSTGVEFNGEFPAWSAPIAKPSWKRQASAHALSPSQYNPARCEDTRMVRSVR